MASGTVNTSTYASSVGNAYLQLTWSASASGSNYNVSWSITAQGINTYYYLALHYVKLTMAGSTRFESADVGINAYSGTTVASGSFTCSSGDFSIELLGGFYSYSTTNVSGSGTMSLPALTPTLSISKVSSTSSTITIKCSVTNSVSATNYRVYSGSTVVATSTSSTITLTGLTSSTKYTIKAQGYANGSWGSDSNILYITTSSTSTISSIGDFTLDGVDIELSNSSGESSDIVVLIDGVEILRREGITSSSYSLVLTDEEKQTIYELIGNNSSISAVIRVESPSGEYNDYDTSITLSGDVFSCKINVDGTIKRGKVWVGTSSGNKQGIFCVGTSTGYVRGN